MKQLLITIAAVVLVGFSVQQQSAIAQQSPVSEPVAETANPEESVDLKNNGSNQIVMNGVRFVAIMFGCAGLLYFFFRFKMYETRDSSN